MDINGGDKNRVFLHDLIKITEGTVSEGTIFMHIIRIGEKSVWKTYGKFNEFNAKYSLLHIEG